MEPSATGEAAAALRREFDAGFASAHVSNAVAGENMLILRLADDTYGVRMGQVRGLHVGRPIIAMPTRCRELLGLAGFRGQVVAVYDLGALLDYPKRSSARWLMLSGDTSIAFAFDMFQRHLTVSPQDLVANDPDAADKRHCLRGAIRNDNGPSYPIIHLPDVVEILKQRVAAIPPTMER